MKNNYFRKIFAISILSSLVWGCSKGDSSNSTPSPAPVNPYAWTNCATCANLRSPTTGLVGVKSSTVDEKVLLSLDLIMDASVSNINYSDPKVILYYNGPLVVQGVLRVVESNNFEVCGAPIGDYVLRPLNLGQSSGGILSGGTYEALGPARIVIRIGSSALYNQLDPLGVSRNSQSNRINLNAYIDYVNSIPCGPLATR